MKDNKFLRRSIIGLLVLVIVFIIDIFIPLGVAVGVLYVGSIVLLIYEKEKTILLFSILATFFIILVPILTTTENTTWMAYVNRFISIIAIWILYFVSIKHKKLWKRNKIYTHQLEQNNKELEQFVYIASHDLQEPLNTILSFTNLLKDDCCDEPEGIGQQSIGIIESATERMRGLVFGLLEYSRIGQQKELEVISVNKLIDSIKTEISETIKATKAEIQYQDLLEIKAYKANLRMLFKNLLLNAIKYRKENQYPLIKISVKEELTQYKYSVTDNGIGINVEFKNKIFEIFKRLHTANEYNGVGLGLANCKRIVELHKGLIWVESCKNGGSTFVFTIKKNLL